MERGAANLYIPQSGTRQQRQDPYGRLFTLRINSTGQRGDEVGSRQPEERRILFIGDSFTIGSDLREEDIFVTQVGETLRSKTRLPVSTLNGGVNGYNTFQQLTYYHYYGQMLDPDIVVLCFFMGNDFRDNAVRPDHGRTLSPVLIPSAVRAKYQTLEDLFLRDAARKIIVDPISGLVIPLPDSPQWAAAERHSSLLRLLGGRSRRLLGRWTGDLFMIDLADRYYYYEIGQYQREQHTEHEVAMELTLDLISQIDRMVSATGVEFMVALLPSQNQVDEEAWQRVLTELRVNEEALGKLYESSLFARSQSTARSDRLPA